MSNPTIEELNRHLFAALLPHTHALDKTDAPKAAGKGKGKTAAPKADEQPREVTLTDAQVAALADAGITDPAAADPDAVAGILAAAGLPL